MSAIRLERRTDGVAVLWFDTPDSPVNVLSGGLMEELAPLLDSIEGDPAVRAVVVASAKPGTFIAGADLKQIARIEEAAEAEALSSGGQRMLDRLAGFSRPVVAAVWGPALGGGLEVALACHYILAADDPKTVLALPEVMLGLLPGAGGTQRLPRRIGLVQALPLMLTGKRLRAGKAYRLGLVDGLTSPGGLVETASRAALDLADGKLRRRKVRRPAIERLLGSSPLRSVVFSKARKSVRARTRGNYPAPGFIIESVERGLRAGMKEGLATESRRFGQLVVSPEAGCLIRLFEAMNESKKARDGAEPRKVRRLAVLGGGFMGSGIASVSLSLTPTVVKDVRDEALAGCAREVRQGLDHRVRSRSISRFERDRLMARLHLTTDPHDLGGADLVIEAVFEDLELKRRILDETEAVIAPEAIFASNTSALPIGEIAARARHPERVLGMHYFSPVPKMPLLELIATPRTAAWAIDTAKAFGIKQGKTVIVVQDGPGFYTSRILSPFINEAMLLLEEGARIEDVDRAIKDFGYPVGPVALLDEIGIDVAAHVARQFGELYAERGHAGSASFVRLNEAGYGGRKNRKGFYVYPAEVDKRKRKKQINPDVYAFFGGADRKAIPAEQIADRLALLMVNEAVLCLQEGVLASARDGDLGAILGLGFPPFRGGPFRWLDALGPAEAVAKMERLRDAHGKRFTPAPLLADTARGGKRFTSA